MIVLGTAFVASLVVLTFLLVDNIRNRTRKVRRREFQSAQVTINDIDSIVDRSYFTVELVGQAMCDEIRDAIHKHRKETTSR